MSGRPLSTLLLGSAVVTLVALVLAVAPGLRDELVLQHPFLQATPLWVRWGLSDAVALPKQLISWTVAPWLLALGIVCRRRRIARMSRTEVIVWGLAVLALLLEALSVRASILPDAGVDRLATDASATLGGLAVAAGLGAAARRRLLGVLTAAGAFVAAYAVGQHFDVDLMPWVPADMVRARSIGTLGNPDFLASFLAPLVPLAVWMRAGEGESARRAAVWGAAAGVIAAATVFTYTRGAWLALLVEAAVMAACGRRGCTANGDGGRDVRRPFLVTAAGVFALLGAALMTRQTDSGHGDHLARRLTGTFSAADHSSATRISLWREAGEVIARHPMLGTGPCTFSYAMLPYREHDAPLLKARAALAGDPHNALLEVAASSGIPAAAILCGLVGGALLQLGRAWRDGGGATAGSLLASLAGLAVAHMFVGFTVPTAWLLWLLVGFALFEAPAGVAAADAAAIGVVEGGLLTVGALVSLAIGVISYGMVQTDLAFNLASQQAEALFSQTAAPVELRLVADTIDRIGLAAAQAPAGPRRTAMQRREGDLLVRLYARATPEMRRTEPFWRAVGEQALVQRRAEVAENPLDPYAWNALASVLHLQVGDPAAAAGSGPEAASTRARIEAMLAASREACARDRHNALLWATHAVRCAEVGNAVEAEEAFRRALDLAPQQVDARLDYARFLLTQQRRDEAHAQIEEALRRAPDSARAQAMRQETRK